MRLRNWLLTGTSLGLLAFAPLPAQAQSAELTAAYQAYVTAQAGGDAAATEAALGAFTEQCIVAGYASVDECVAALSGAAPAAPAADDAAAAAAAAQAEADAAAAAQAEADAAAAAQAEADAAAAAQAQADADAAAAAAQAEADAAAAKAQADADAQAKAEADAAAAAQAEADAAAAAAAAAQAAPAEQPAAEQPAGPTAEELQAQFVNDLNAALAEYQAALDQAAGGGDFADAQAKANAASARILELCTANGYADIASCIGQELPPLPQPAETPAEQPAAEQPAAEQPPAEAPAEQPAAEAPAEQPAAEAPAEQPAAEAPAEQPAAEAPAEQPAVEEPAPVGEPAVIEAPPPVDPTVQAQADIGTAIELYNAGIGQLQAGNADGQGTVDLALQQITAACEAAGNADVAACLAAFGFPPLAEVPQVAAVEPTPTVELSPAIDEIVTPDAVEALPVDIAPESAAPLLDSSKDVATDVAAGEAPAPVVEAEPETPAPTSDAEAQAKIAPIEVQSVEAEQGAEIAQEAIVIAAPEPAALPQNVTIIQNNVTNVTNNTTIINNNAPSAPVIFQVGINIVINNPGQERDRMYRPDEDRIYYEELRNGRTRETIVRPNGVRIVTVRNRWGDVLKRSRFSPDGREFILAYYDDSRDDDRDSDRDGFFIDPGDELPPLRLNIPARDYILDVEDADEEEVELFFRQPPVEQVRRIYSVEEVKRSARVRDSVRRIEIGGLTFDSGKATISSTQVGALSKVARAMLAVLEENPAETFLIEGHTDAVGSDESNLVLSDQRASVVAQILTDFYKVPPENLTTQGYGERYLKVNTEGNEPINRRVTIKRITSLITVAAN